MAERENLNIATVLGNMCDLSDFEDGSFDFILHPCSNTFVPAVRPIWHEAFRVLRANGVLVAGFCNPLLFIFDDERLQNGELIVRHSIPYSDFASLTVDELAKYEQKNEPACFGHTLDDQIGGQIDAGLCITGFFEDDWGPDSDNVLSRYIKSFVATRATKPSPRG